MRIDVLRVLTFLQISVAGGFHSMAEERLCVHIELIDDDEKDGFFGGAIAGTGKAEFYLKLQPEGRDSRFLLPVNVGKNSGSKSVSVITPLSRESCEHKSLSVELLDRDKATTKSQKAMAEALKQSGRVLIESGKAYAISEGFVYPEEGIESLRKASDAAVRYVTRNSDTSLFDSYGTRIVRMKGISAASQETANPVTFIRDGRAVADIYFFYQEDGHKSGRPR